MKKHLTTLTALSAALFVPMVALAQDAVDTNNGDAPAPAASSSADSQNATDTSAANASDKTDAQLKNEELEAAQARYNSGEAGKYEYIPPKRVDRVILDDDDTSDIPDVDGESVDEEKETKDWSVYAEALFDLGIGAFTKDEHARKVRSAFTFDFGATYKIPVIDVTIGAETGFRQWMSKAGGTNGQYEFRWADTEVSLARDIWTYEDKENDFNVGIAAGLGFNLPTSKASIKEHLYLTLAPELDFSIGIAGFSFDYSIQYGHSFHEYTSPSYDPSEVDVLSRSRGNEILGSHDIATDGVLTEIELVNSIKLSYKFIDELSIALGFAFADSWTYDNGTITKDDEYVSKYAKVGRGHSQLSAGSLALIYTPIKYVILSLGISSKQPWKTADNQTIRFPWFDFVSPNKNYTKLFFGATFIY